MTTDIDAATFALRRLGVNNDYVRHIYNILVNWFTFFITINYASMGWLATKTPDTETKWGLVLLIAVLFITQNFLGVWAELVVLAYIKRATREAAQYEEMVTRPDIPLAKNNCIPLEVYRKTIYLMICALVTIMLSWIAFPFLFAPPPARVVGYSCSLTGACI